MTFVSRPINAYGPCAKCCESYPQYSRRARASVKYPSGLECLGSLGLRENPTPLIYFEFLPLATPNAKFDFLGRPPLQVHFFANLPDGPFGFVDADNELAGFDVDVARAFAAKLGVNLNLAMPSWQTILSEHWQER